MEITFAPSWLEDNIDELTDDELIECGYSHKEIRELREALGNKRKLKSLD